MFLSLEMLDTYIVIIFFAQWLPKIWDFILPSSAMDIVALLEACIFCSLSLRPL